MDDGFWTPRNIVILTIAVTAALNLVFVLTAFKGYTAQQFQCRRCDRGFRRAPYRRMPRRCPRCGATDWNA